MPPKKTGAAARTSHQRPTTTSIATTTVKQSLAAGMWVALTLKPDTAPLRVYVGVIQVADDRGVRITCVDWLVGTPSGYDVFAPWDSIVSAHIAIPSEHDVGHFGDAAARWQKHMDDRPESPSGM